MLEVINLKKQYGSDMILNGVNLQARPGEIIAIMGPSGCGKSTFIRCINRLVEPDGGEVYFKGTPLHKLSEGDMEEVRQNIGFVFQHFNLIDRLKVRQNVALGLIKKGFSIKEAEDKARLALKDVGLKELADTEVKNLSGGEKQRVGIARALVMEPDLILMDEPTASLDPILVTEVLDVLEEIVRQKKQTTMIIVTHQVAFARRVADKIYFMDKGKFIESGPPDEVLESPVSWIGKKYKSIINYY
ncbi:amino acid ABC transporter ATP-binding protein [Halothermothrix orenii]|uniref:ABC transporter related n=1 Tax=Halothermothrix orenii (strain H 168 / OCM 544 / DSM 9562) TaxID=373903 RepID=B8CYY8_HALOH|nr:amino acid ABC transporter ATP-binding protein [Halothermothrix orenii]ACL70507.1 ABC transporter related [Halothermothrix orenii H 168]